MPLPRKHILKNSATLLRLGIDPADVERTASFVEKHLPDGADADTWLPTARELEEGGIVTEATVLDARLQVYRNKAFPRRQRRLLDATGGA